MKITVRVLVGFLCTFLFIFGFSLQAQAAAPFSDSFDLYEPASLYTQGGWQNNNHTWHVTDQGCYGNVGKCIASTGLHGSNWKSGVDTPKGEWRIRFYVHTDFGRSDLVPYISFGSAQQHRQSDITIFTDAPGTMRVRDNRGNVLGPPVPIKEWHTLVYKWDMADPTNCRFSISIDGGPDEPTAPSIGSPTDCYNNVYRQGVIGSIELSTYHVGYGQVLFDDFGDGPTVVDCVTDCSSTTSPIVDDFELFNIKGWQVRPTPYNTLTLFTSESAASTNCRTGACVVANGGVGGLGTLGSSAEMYLETGNAREEGVFTVWARSRLGYRLAAANVSICATQWSNCFSPYLHTFANVVPSDDTWHQVYIAWRQGSTFAEVCKLLDNTNPDNCNWVPTTFPLGTKFDGIQLSGTNFRSDLGDQVWFDELREASTTPLGPTCTQQCYSNVLFLPGFEASRLYKDTAGADAKLWEPGSDADAAQLALDIHGNSLEAVYTKEGDVLDNAYVPVFGNIYKSFISNMNKLRTDGTIVDWQPVAYDWRLALDQIVNSGTKTDSRISYTSASNSPYIIEELHRLAASSKTGKVTLVAHSNGGLVAKALMMKLGPDASKYVDKIIMVGVPQLGTPQTIATLLHGTNGGMPFNHLSEKAARDIAQNMPGAYTLLPSHSYFTYIDNPVVSFDASATDWVQRYGSTIHSAELLRTFMADTARAKPQYADLKTPQVSNQNVYDAAVVAHIGLDTWTPPSDVELVTVAGWGQDTLAGIAYRTVTTNACIQRNIIGLCTSYKKGSELTFDPQHVVDGDGTVIAPSALWSNGATSTRYWLNLESYNSNVLNSTLGFAPIKHTNILEVPEISEFVKNHITKNTTRTYKYLSTSAPTANKSRLNFTLHSPLTLGFRDSLGNYAGSTATTTVLAIPGVEYRRYGEVQWLSVPADLVGQLALEGTASGSFTLNIAETNEGGIVATSSFEGVPSATSTIVTMNISPSVPFIASSTLLVDYDGDNTTDATLQAVPGVTVHPDTTAPSTTARIVGTQGTNGWFTSNVEVELRANDLESGVADTHYSLKSATSTTLGSSTSPYTIVLTDGVHVLTYYSVDHAGNVEQATSTTIRVDTTSPEATIHADVARHDLSIVGTDNLSSTTVTKTDTTATITDQAGNTTMLTFKKIRENKRLTSARLTHIQYGTSTPTALPTSFLYTWTPTVLTNQIVRANDTFTIHTMYNPRRETTILSVFERGSLRKTQTVSGQVLIKLTTNRGAVKYGW